MTGFAGPEWGKYHQVILGSEESVRVLVRRKLYDAVDYTMCFKSPEGVIIETEHKLSAFKDTGEYESVTERLDQNVILSWYRKALEFDLLEYAPNGDPVIIVALTAHSQNKPFNQDHEIKLFFPSHLKQPDESIARIYTDFQGWMTRQQIRRNR